MKYEVYRSIKSCIVLLCWKIINKWVKISFFFVKEIFATLQCIRIKICVDVGKSSFLFMIVESRKKRGGGRLIQLPRTWHSKRWYNIVVQRTGEGVSVYGYGMPCGDIVFRILYLLNFLEETGLFSKFGNGSCASDVQFDVKRASVRTSFFQADRSARKIYDKEILLSRLDNAR